MSNAHENINSLLTESSFEDLLTKILDSPQIEGEELSMLKSAYSEPRGYAELDMLNMLLDNPYQGKFSGRFGIPVGKNNFLELLINQYTREGLPQDFGFKFSKGFK